MTEKEKLFIEYTFKGIELRGWQDFVNKWKLKIVTDDNAKRCTADNDDYSICMTGESIFYLIDDIKEEDPSVERPEIDQPADNISLIMSDKIETKSMLSFLKDFIDVVNYVDNVDFDIHVNKIESIIHPNWILDRM